MLCPGDFETQQESSNGDTGAAGGADRLLQVHAFSREEFTELYGGLPVALFGQFSEGYIGVTGHVELIWGRGSGRAPVKRPVARASRICACCAILCWSLVKSVTALWSSLGWNLDGARRIGPVSVGRPTWIQARRPPSRMWRFALQRCGASATRERRRRLLPARRR